MSGFIFLLGIVIFAVYVADIVFPKKRTLLPREEVRVRMKALRNAKTSARP